MEREKSVAMLAQDFPARKAERRWGWREGVTDRLYGFCVDTQVKCLYFVRIDSNSRFGFGLRSNC